MKLCCDIRDFFFYSFRHNVGEAVAWNIQNTYYDKCGINQSQKYLIVQKIYIIKSRKKVVWVWQTRYYKIKHEVEILDAKMQYPIYS